MLGLPIAGGRERWFGLAQAYAERYPAVELELREALSEHLQRQVLAREIDGALALAPSRLPSLTYTHVHDEPLSVVVAREPSAGRPRADRPRGSRRAPHHAARPVGRQRSATTGAIRALFEATESAPVFVETPEVYPRQRRRAEDYLGLSGRHDFPAGVVRVALVPPVTLPFEFVQRAGATQLGGARVRAVRLGVSGRAPRHVTSA